MPTGKLVKTLTDDLFEHIGDLGEDFCEGVPGDERGDDVRLRLHEGEWELKTGDASFDDDHRGHWGGAWVSVDATREECEGIARDLIKQVREARAMARTERRRRAGPEVFRCGVVISAAGVEKAPDGGVLEFRGRLLG